MSSCCIKNLGLRHHDATKKDTANMTKRPTTIYIDDVIWDNFMKYLIEKHGKTHGGVISEEDEKAIKLLIKKQHNQTY
jgi:glutathione peroxidase-family protein